MNPKYFIDVENLPHLSPREKAHLSQVQRRYRFRANAYYLSLIDWNDPNDPIRQLIIPHAHELEEWGQLDPSGEHRYTVMPGLEHKYASTVLMLVSNVCGGICRYCFRKRVFMDPRRSIVSDIPAAIEYIRGHREITNVLITGGDPLALSTNKLRKIIEPLLAVDHVRIVRLGTKLAAFNPYRIVDDPDLPVLLRRVGERGKQLYGMVHFNHVRELSAVAVAGLKVLHQAGAVLANQTPIIRGVNDTPEALADLFDRLSFVGAPPYYLFQCRPACGNKQYAVPLEEAYQIFEQARARVSGLAKRARFVMSHVSGKIEIVGRTASHVYFKYLRAARAEDSGRFFACRRNSDAYWLDDYEPAVESEPLAGAGDQALPGAGVRG